MSFKILFICFDHAILPVGSSSPTRYRTRVPYSGRGNLNHWTTREASELRSLIENLEAISDCDDCSLGPTGE